MFVVGQELWELARTLVMLLMRPVTVSMMKC